MRLTIESLRQVVIGVNSKKGRQAGGLFISNVISLPIGIITSYILTKILGEVSFGNYSFLLTVFNFSVIFFGFGIFQASSRAIVLGKDEKIIGEYYGTTLIYLIVLYLIMSIFLIIYVRYDHNINEKELSTLFYYIIPFGFVFLLTRYIETLFQADNRIKELAICRLYPKIGFLAICLLLFFSSSVYQNILILVLLAYIITQLVVYVYISKKINISFSNFRIRAIEIFEFNKSFGLHVYFGSLFSLGIAQSTGVLISYFSKDNSAVGFYALALSLASPLMMIPNTIATIYYKEFVQYNKIPRKITLYTIFITIAVYVGLLLIMPYVILRIYGENFDSVISLFFIVGAGSLLYGFGDFYNRYLMANGRGKELRNSAIAVGISLLLFNYLFVPNWKAYGAAYAYVGGGLCYLLCMILYYLKFIKSKEL